MKTRYKFDYDNGLSSCNFLVDRDKFTVKMAKDTLDFFSWDEEPDTDNDLIDEVIKKYARMAIILATENYHNTTGVISDFKQQEGYYNVDGSDGITLEYVEHIEVKCGLLDVEIENI